MDPPFYLDGQMMGVYNLTVGESRELQIGVHATSIQINNGSFLSTPQAGIIRNAIIARKKIQIILIEYETTGIAYRMRTVV